MSDKETKEQVTTAEGGAESGTPETKETATGDTPEAPEPMATGNEQLAILKHDLYSKDGDNKEAIAIGLKVKNISGAVIGSALFEAELYDIYGNILGTVEKKAMDFKPGATRTIRLEYSGPDSDKVRSYCAKLTGIAMPPEPAVTDNESIKILKYSLNIGLKDELGNISSADITIRNVSQSTAASIIFEATFYDIEGNVLETIRQRETDLKPSTSRAVTILLDKPGVEKIKSYSISIVKVTTADVEKVQLRHHDMRTTSIGEGEVSGTVKNISSEKVDTALVASFFDYTKENIGTRVLILRDIVPNSIKQFRFSFKLMKGDRLKSYTLDIGDLALQIGTQ